MKNPFYFTRHVTESIAINRARRPFYKALTQGKSESAFRLLLTLEYLMIPTAIYYDLRAGYYQKRGIPLFADELRSMDGAPDFNPSVRKTPDTDIPNLPWKKYYADLRTAIRTNDPRRVTLVTTRIIGEMSAFPGYYPMTRHLIESVHRFAWFLPAREKSAEEKKLRSPRPFIMGVLSYHLLGLWYFVLIDRAGAPVHREGIPMLTSELPDLLADLP